TEPGHEGNMSLLICRDINGLCPATKLAPGAMRCAARRRPKPVATPSTPLSTLESCERREVLPSTERRKANMIIQDLTPFLVGGYTVGYYGYPRPTNVDIWRDHGSVHGGQGGATGSPDVQQRLIAQLGPLLAGNFGDVADNIFLADLVWWKDEQMVV